MSGKHIKEHMIHNSTVPISASGFFSPIRIRTLKSRIRSFFALFTQKVPNRYKSLKIEYRISKINLLSLILLALVHTVYYVFLNNLMSS